MPEWVLPNLIGSMAELVDAADLKSVGRKRLWGFKSPCSHEISRENTSIFKQSAPKRIISLMSGKFQPFSTTRQLRDSLA